MTKHTVSTATPNRRTRRVVGLAALTALGLPLSVVLAPGTASAAPGGVDDVSDVLVPHPELPMLPADFLPVIPPVLPMLPADFLPVIPPVFPVLPAPPAPDDGPSRVLPSFPGGPIVSIPDVEIELFPGDWLLPPADDDEEPEPECAEYSAANFGVVVDRYDDDLIEVQLTYTDDEVCDFTVWSAVAAPGAVGVLGETTVGMQDIASQTGDDLYYQQTFSDHDLCDLEIRIAVEESLAVTYPHTDPGCETPEEGETPDDGETPDEGETPDDDETPDDGETPDGGGELIEETPEEIVPTDADPKTPPTPSGGLPQTGTDLTTVMLAIGLLTLGAGSIVALATRRRDELPTA